MIDTRFRYGPDEHAFYEQQGYHLFEHFLSESGLADLSRRIDAMIDQRHETVSPEFFIGAHQYEPSPPNRSDRWRRVIVVRYLAADAKLGPNTYTHHRTGEPFQREIFLVRGRDVKNHGLRTSPFE